MAQQQRTKIALSLMIAGILAGCSGGGGNNNNNGNTPPPGGNTPPPMLTGDTFAVTSANRLVSFNASAPNTATAVNITGLASGETVIAADLRPGGSPAGQMYALTSAARLYTIDPSSGTATLKSTLVADPSDNSAPFSSFSGTTRVSIDVNNFVDQLRVVTNTGQNLRVMMDTGATFSDTPITVGGVTPNGLSEVGYTNNFSTTCRNTVYYIDTSTDRLLTSANASGGILTPVGNLAVDATAISGFDISTAADGTNTAFAALTVSGTTSLYTINLQTGVATVVGAIGSLNSGESVVGLARPVPATAPTQPVGELLALTDNNGLVSFQSAVPSKLCTSTTISGLQANESVLGIDTRPSDRNVYALTNSGRLYTVDSASGAATLKVTLTADASDTTDPYGPADFQSGITIDVSPGADQLRAINGNGKNLRINMDTGATFSDTPISSSALNPANAGVTAISYTNSFAGTTGATLYVIDTVNDRLLIQGRPPSNASAGDLSNVAPLGIQGDVQPLAALEINAINNAAFAAFQVGTTASNTSDLYSIDLTGTTAASRIGTIGANARVRALTYSNAPQATLLGITQDNRLVSFNLTTPGTYNSILPINGLQGGENIIGFDVRPSNQTMYLLTDGARVYTLNTTTGMAMLTSTLTPADNTFRGLIGSTFGVDFSPPQDAMRVITDAEHNIAVFVDSGATIAQSSLVRIGGDAGTLPSPDIVASAYTNNYANAGVTTLYNIDVTANLLLKQMPAANGRLETVGPLTSSTTRAFTLSGGFDIVGGDNGLAVAALQPNGAAQSTLYRVNLQTGALSDPIGLIGPANSQRLMGLTIRLQ